MEQPLDLSFANQDSRKKKPFTIEYLTSDLPKQIRRPLFIEPLSYTSYFTPPLHPVENHLNYNYQQFALPTEHVVPTICSPPIPVRRKERFLLENDSIELLECTLGNGQRWSWNKKSSIRLRN